MVSQQPVIGGDHLTSTRNLTLPHVSMSRCGPVPRYSGAAALPRPGHQAQAGRRVRAGVGAGLPGRHGEWSL